MKVHVKNMVCDRCKSVLENEFTKAGFLVDHIALGEINFSNEINLDMETIKEILNRHGFEMIEDNQTLLVSKIKAYLIELLNNNESDVNLTVFLASKMNKDYSIISKVFSSRQELTIEKYFIKLKIEKVKELIQMNNMSFSEIAYSLNYKNSSHLAKQFKSITGLSMSEYKNLQNWNRKGIDKIV